MQRRGEIRIWSDREIHAGREWAQEIDTHLDAADIILLLVSPDFVASDYIYSKEMDRALARHAEGKARVIPIILRIGDYENEPFSQLQSLPSNHVPVTHWPSDDEAWFNVIEGIKNAIHEMTADNQGLLQSETYFPLDQARISGQEIDHDEIVSPTIERLLFPPAPYNERKRKHLLPLKT